MSQSLCRVICHFDRLLRNFDRLSTSGKAMMPVVKADAYGHGMLATSAVLAGHGVSRLAVGSVAEGVTLRQNGYSGQILSLLGCVSDADFNALPDYGIVPLIHNLESLERARQIAARRGKKLDIAVKCDSGMGRLGFLSEEMPSVADALCSAGNLKPVLLVSHLAAADCPEEDVYTREQARRFLMAARILKAEWPQMLLSLGNSPCLLSCPELAGDIARPGLALYGSNPLYGTSRADLGRDLEPVMEARVPIVSVHNLRAGKTLGYGRTYRAQTDRRVAWVGIGYADGYRRNPKAGCCMTIHGMRVPVIGRVAMQMTCVDITDLPASVPPVRPGDEACILGGKGEAVTPQELADWWGTIPYEVTCLLGKNRRD